MLDELRQDELQTETGFGTGLRAHIHGRRDGEPAEPLPPEPPPVDEAAEELERERARVARLEAAIVERERSLSVQAAALVAEAKRLAEERAELERKAAELERHVSVRELLRRRAEREVERVWRSFAEALEATRPSGEPDYELRLTAARALLAEAYGSAEEAGELPSALPDELASLRERKVKQATT